MSKDKSSDKYSIFNSHIFNNSSSGDIHIVVPEQSRLEYFKEKITNLSNVIRARIHFCALPNANYDSSYTKYTEDPSVATCRKCIEAAKNFGYESKLLEASQGVLNISKTSIEELKNWIPTNCKVIISSKSIMVEDLLTGEEIKVEKVSEAALLIADKCFKPFNPGKVLENKKMLSKSVFDLNNVQYMIKGLNFDNETNEFDGFILQSSASFALVGLTFNKLLKSGYHFEDGTPCGEYIENRQPLVESEIGKGIGSDIDIMEV